MRYAFFCVWILSILATTGLAPQQAGELGPVYKTLEEAQGAYTKSLQGSIGQKVALAEMSRLCTTVEEANQAWVRAKSVGGDFLINAQKRWDELSYQEIFSATTKEQVQDYVLRSRSGSDALVWAQERLQQLRRR